MNIQLEVDLPLLDIHIHTDHFPVYIYLDHPVEYRYNFNYNNSLNARRYHKTYNIVNLYMRVHCNRDA